MPYSSIDRSIWHDPWFCALPQDARLLFVYCWSSPLVNPACCYRIRLDSVARDAGFGGEADPRFAEAVRLLHPRVQYFATDGYLWVPGFVHHQTGSRDYLKGVANCLAREVPPHIAARVVAHNRRLGIHLEWEPPETVPAEEEEPAGVPDTVSRPSLDGAQTGVNTTPQDKNIIVRAARARQAPESDPEPGRCGWCVNPKGNGAPLVHRLLQFCHDTYKAKRGMCPTLSPPKDGAVLKGIMGTGKTEEAVRQVYAAYLESDDPFVERAGWSLAMFRTKFDAVALGIKRGTVDDGGFYDG